MSFNPFNEKAEKFDNILKNWVGLYPKSYQKQEVDPYTKLRCILVNGAEFEAVWFGHNFHRHCVDNDLRREIALIRRSEQQQQKTIASLKPINEDILETTIGYEHLAVDLTAILARREKNPYVKKALDFALLEDFDHLYRYADLLNMEKGIPAERLVGRYVEIMPGRPTISEHRYPYDDVKSFTDYKTADPITKLNIAIITAAEQQTMNYYMNQAGFYTSDLGRQLYSEIAMIEEQHVSHYGSLIDTNETYLECLLNHEYTECYLYYSCYQYETDPCIKKIWEQHLVAEIAHLQKAAELLKHYEKKEWQQVIPVGEFPELLNFTPQKDYVREVLQGTVFQTAERENYTLIDDLSDSAEFFTYQRIVNSMEENVPSHMVIDQYISANGMDYRYEESKNPITALQNRKEDNTCVGRKKEKVTSRI